MPGYELALIMRVMTRPGVVEGVKRSITSIIERGGIVKKLENLGEKRLPYRMLAHTESFTRGHYFVVEFDSPPDSVISMTEYLHRDIDVIRPTILRRETERQTPPPCRGAHNSLYRPSTRHIKNPGRIRRDVEEKIKELSK
ncbi:small ribosomal subunit protein bS6m-like [Asterias amurensis]|uniref:small ribosomal subunit protein bS6m-like n=1 Tax=Asterias amurensis TaxID=7602 RepID=UPI003AB7FBED